jgi:hypothetical protein
LTRQRFGWNASSVATANGAKTVGKIDDAGFAAESNHSHGSSIAVDFGTSCSRSGLSGVMFI